VAQSQPQRLLCVQIFCCSYIGTAIQIRDLLNLYGTILTTPRIVPALLGRVGLYVQLHARTEAYQKGVLFSRFVLTQWQHVELVTFMFTNQECEHSC
jgi:hypothetical protein